MPAIQTDLCSTAFFFECFERTGKLVGSFTEFLASANTYRGELLGLMAVHLILLEINTFFPGLRGSLNLKIYSNFSRALDKVKGLPPLQLPANANIQIS